MAGYTDADAGEVNSLTIENIVAKDDDGNTLGTPANGNFTPDVDTIRQNDFDVLITLMVT